jgi:molybdenum cofactor guanylyltransferase
MPSAVFICLTGGWPIQAKLPRHQLIEQPSIPGQYRCGTLNPPGALAAGRPHRPNYFPVARVGTLANSISPLTVYHQRVNEVTGFGVTAFILAGGKSTRMGRDKAFIELGGQTLLARALNLSRAVAAECSIAGDPGKFAAFGPVVEDIFPDCGPLGGIHAALRNSHTELNLILAVDLPALTPQFLEYLVAAARKSTALVIVPHAGGALQPLCAIYRREFAEVAERALRRRRNKIDVLFSEIETRVLGEEELLRAGFTPEIFHNLNTPEQWVEAGMKYPRET